MPQKDVHNADKTWKTNDEKSCDSSLYCLGIFSEWWAFLVRRRFLGITRCVFVLLLPFYATTAAVVVYDDNHFSKISERVKMHFSKNGNFARDFS